MKITEVETIPLRLPFSNSFTIATSHEPTRDHLDVLIVKVKTDDGLVGIGETQAWRRQGSSEILLNLIRVVNEMFEPVLIGKSPFDINKIMSELNDTLYNSLYAQAAIGDALYDLMGKYNNVPVHELIGGKCRDKIQVGMALSIASSPQLMLEKANETYEQGYRYLRVKIGMDPKQDIGNIKCLKDHFGDKVVLRADANGGMYYEQALPLLKKLEEYDLDVVEQPVPIWDVDGMAELSRRVHIPISADESLDTVYSLMEIIRKRAASIVQTKAGKNGGIYYSQKLWTVAEAAGMSVFPGNHPSTSISGASVAHLCAASPSLRTVGDFQTGCSELLAHDIVKEPLQIKDGYVTVPGGPGLGMELNEDKVTQFRLDK